MALEGGRLIEEARVDPRQPFSGIPVKAELRSIIRQAEDIGRAAGTSIRNVARIQQFHAGLADLPAAIEVWAESMDLASLPLSADRGRLAASSRRASDGRFVGACAGREELTEWIDERRVHPGLRGRIFGFQSLSTQVAPRRVWRGPNDRAATGIAGTSCGHVVKKALGSNVPEATCGC